MLLIIFIIWFILFKIINNNKIEKFSTSSPTASIPYTILTSDVRSVTTKPIQSSQSKIHNYYSIFEVMETSDNNNYFFNIYYSYRTQTPSENISYNIFPNSIINKNPIVLTKPANRPLPDEPSRTRLNKIINENYIVVDFINQYNSDTKFRINNIKIAVDKRSVTDIGSIYFYTSSNTGKTSDPYEMILNDMLYLSSSVENKTTFINIYTYSFTSSIIDPPILDDIIIHFKTSNDVVLYYINIYGLPSVNYNNFIKSIQNSNNGGDTTNLEFQGADVLSSRIDETDYDAIAGNIDSYNNSQGGAVGGRGASSNEFNTSTVSEAFRKIIENNIPWAVYNGSEIVSTVAGNRNNITLPDLFGRQCRNAIVNDPNNEFNTIVSREECKYNGYDLNNIPISKTTRIKHLKGSRNVSIDFPLGSLPYKYTICAITRYTGTSSRGRIVTSKNISNPINFYMGHWGGYKHVGFNNQPRSDTKQNGDTNWVVSCMKSTGNEKTTPNGVKFNTILFNGEASGNNNFIGFGYQPNQSQDTNNILSINGVEQSDFGLSYLLIWDYVLTDGELDLVSKNLINTLLDDSYNLPLSTIQINNPKDALIPETSVDNPKIIIDNTCSTINNYYWINILNSKQKIFCILDNKVGNFGGGWMLAMKGAKDKTTFMFNSPYWTTNNTLNSTVYPFDIFSDTTTEIKTDIFNFYKFSEILIIYNDPRFNSNRYYKTSYYKLNNLSFIGKYSLTEFFANNFNDLNYNNIDRNIVLDFRTQMLNFNDMSNPGCINRKLDMNGFDIRFICDPNGFNHTPDIFTHQNVCKAYGINLNFNSWPWGRLVARIGAVFNENPGSYFQSIDACGGIGLNVRYSAGDVLGCCQSSTGINSSLPFLLFVR